MEKLGAQEARWTRQSEPAHQEQLGWYTTGKERERKQHLQSWDGAIQEWFEAMGERKSRINPHLKQEKGEERKRQWWLRWVETKSGKVKRSHKRQGKEARRVGRGRETC